MRKLWKLQIGSGSNVNKTTWDFIIFKCFSLTKARIVAFVRFISKYLKPFENDSIMNLVGSTEIASVTNRHGSISAEKTL